MTTHWVNEAAVVTGADYVTVMLVPDEEVAIELRDLLAKVNAEGVEGTSRELRQLLSDTEAALQKAFRARPTSDSGVSDGR